MSTLVCTIIYQHQWEYIGLYYYISHWCVLLYIPLINTNESTLVCTIIYQHQWEYISGNYYISIPMRVHWWYYYISTPMRVHWCVLLYIPLINTNESTLVCTIIYQHNESTLTLVCTIIWPTVTHELVQQLWSSWWLTLEAGDLCNLDGVRSHMMLHQEGLQMINSLSPYKQLISRAKEVQTESVFSWW